MEKNTAEAAVPQGRDGYFTSTSSPACTAWRSGMPQDRRSATKSSRAMGCELPADLIG